MKFFTMRYRFAALFYFLKFLDNSMLLILVGAIV